MNPTIQVKARKALNHMKPYSPGKPIWEVQQELGIDKVIKLASNENPLGASPKAVEAIIAYLPEIHRYPDASTKGLNEAIAAQLQLTPDQLIVTNGADELIKLVAEAFLEEGDEVVVPHPSFSEYEFGAHLMGAVPVPVPLDESYQYHVEDLLSAVTERTKMVFLCSPNNPTGTYLSREDLRRLLNALPKDVLVMYDSAYSHFASAEDYTDGLEFVREGNPVIVLQTFSKIYGLAGIRVGFGAAPAPIIASILQVKEPFNVNALAQEAAKAAIADTEHVEASRRVNALGREQLYEAFRVLGLSYTESMTNFILVKLGPDAKELYGRLMELGVIVRYGGTWGMPEHIRVTVGTQEENDFFIRQLTSLLGE
ncbi:MULTISPECIES: histidinol-phosphate transaminase [unclassified Paenibacillus]|uniref:histidinol-phosphate transaminase n=1 Tax=unclassified Paenibacillus TaxID=185978 RepID=UPI0009ADBD77|nr:MULTISPECIES: histidinol-phosphate transaminase [unclassified Paenibacillus]MBE1441642.1 histidinol-phosphate aminotransferase [Paenibacillus sp. OAS669]